MGEKLFLGVARRNITPAVGGCLVGYAPDVRSVAVNDDLTVTAFCFEQNGKRALLASFTLAGIAKKIADGLRLRIEEAFGIPRSAIILHGTHTHSGPNLLAAHGWGDPDYPYLEEILIPALLSAVEEALGNRKSVTMAITSGESLVGINRRERLADGRVKLGQNPWGEFDPTMTVISFADEEDAPVANIIHYSCHGTAAGRNHEITRDFSGVMTDTLEAQTGAITAFFNGTIGDAGPRLTNGRTVGMGDVGFAMRLGAVAGQDAVRIYNQPKYRTHPRLSLISCETRLPLLPRIPLIEAKEKYEPFRGKTINIEAQSEKHYRSIIESYENGYEELAFHADEQTVLRLGDLAIVATPFELFSEIGLRIKKDSPVPHTLLLSNANGSEGYFATESELCRGGYEIDMFLTKYLQAPVPDADFHFITQTLENLEKTENT